MLKILKKIDYFLAQIFVFIIIIYQKTLSPDQGWLKIFFPQGFCRFHPHCSEYGKQALQKKGFARGIFLTSWRILRCNPWSKGGVDEIK